MNPPEHVIRDAFRWAASGQGPCEVYEPGQSPRECFDKARASLANAQKTFDYWAKQIAERDRLKTEAQQWLISIGRAKPEDFSP